MSKRNDFPISKKNNKETLFGLLPKISWHQIAPPPPPVTSDFSGKVGLNLALGPGYFLLQLKDYMLETFMLLARVRFRKAW